MNKQTPPIARSLLIWILPLLGLGLLAWQAWVEVTGDDYRIQEDARQHIFWMLRYVDPAAFPNDPIADYFQALAPWLYRAIYAGSWFGLGIEPQSLTLILPPLLGLAAVSYTVLIGRYLSPAPMVGSLAGLLCAQTLWMEDDLVSATPRAFATPLMLAFLYYALRRNTWGCGLTIAMQAGLYPPAALMSWGTACLRVGDRRDRSVWLAATVCLTIALLPLLLQPDAFGSMVSVQEARTMLEFQAVGDDYGRAFFFHDNPLVFWGFGPRTGFFFWGLMAPLNLAACGWPWLRRAVRQSSPSPASRSSAQPVLRHPDSKILGQFLLSAILFYGVAYLVLFKLHFPARYTYHGFRTVLPIAAAIVLFALGCWQIRQWQRRSHWLCRMANLGLASFQVVLLLLPFAHDLNIDNQLYATGKADDLYAMLQREPLSTLVATLDKEGNNLPIFAGRSTLTSGEYALPYHSTYYDVIRQRAKDLLVAHTATEPQPLLNLLERYPITHILTREDSFTPEYLHKRKWLHPFQPEFDQAVKQLEAQQRSGEMSLLEQLQPVCTVLEERNLLLIDATCLRDRLP